MKFEDVKLNGKYRVVDNKTGHDFDIGDIVQDEVGKANKFLGEIKRIVNDIKNKKQDTTATFG